MIKQVLENIYRRLGNEIDRIKDHGSLWQAPEDYRKGYFEGIEFARRKTLELRRFYD